VSRLRDENEVLNKVDGSLDSNADVQKHLETQHWLELVDGCVVLLGCWTLT